MIDPPPGGRAVALLLRQRYWMARDGVEDLLHGASATNLVPGGRAVSRVERVGASHAWLQSGTAMVLGLAQRSSIPCQQGKSARAASNGPTSPSDGDGFGGSS